jgi:hypothetical protein
VGPCACGARCCRARVAEHVKGKQMFQGTYRGSPELLEAYHLMYARANRRTRKPTGHKYHPSKHGPHIIAHTVFFSQPAARLFSSFLCSWVIFWTGPMPGPMLRPHAAPCGPMHRGFPLGPQCPGAQQCPAVPCANAQQPAASSQRSAVPSSQCPVHRIPHIAYRMAVWCPHHAPRAIRQCTMFGVWYLVLVFACCCCCCCCGVW